MLRIVLWPNLEIFLRYIALWYVNPTIDMVRLKVQLEDSLVISDEANILSLIPPINPEEQEN